jgi:hypothetical protein
MMGHTNQKLADDMAIVAYTEFTEGKMRSVFENADGRQFVIDDGGNRVFGIWFIPEAVDRPVSVDDREF